MAKGAGADVTVGCGAGSGRGGGGYLGVGVASFNGCVVFQVGLHCTVGTTSVLNCDSMIGF
jgi:hypothetical protein